MHANDVACKIMGISEHEIVGPSSLEMEWEFVNEDGSPLPWEEQSFMLTLQTGKPVRNKVIGIQHDSLPARRWVLGNSEPVFDLNGEKLTQVVSTFVDITQLKQTEECLRESEERYRLLVEHFPDMIAAGHDGFCSYMNRGGARLLGSDDASGFIGEDIFRYIPKEEHKLILDMIDSVQNKGGIIKPIEHKMVKINGDTVDVETTVMPIHYNGKPATMNVTREITERKRTEEALRKADTLSIAGKLAAGVAHEVRNPLTVLKGFLQLYKEKEKDGAAYLDIMLSEVDRIEFIITEFLMLAKPHLITFKQNSIQEIVQRTITLFETQAIMERVEIVSHFASDLPLIECEENQLKQVFINILKNALESMKEGGRILVEVEKPDASSVLIRFTDEGCGIPEEKLVKLGEPFYTTKEKGTGLGLMVSYNIIKNHKGKINVKSKMEKGTCFEVILPVVN
ncbi:PAS domain-containing sensor histidine kinase [Aneurinibacillus tyrosinisolvens]|uniref:PAS domain-containing sensor histidine kinase n=1 Tax=Aneurinibacillus tyrosinisolvens TaxID=1443435 RepID=UPI00069C87A6